MYSELYLDSFTLPDVDAEWDFFMKQPSTCYTSHYPFQIIARERETTFEFDDMLKPI